MSYRYPYGNTEQMNLDWFLNQWEKFKADWAEAEAGIDGSLDAEIAKVEAAMSELYAARDAAAASATAARQSSLDAAAAQVAAGNSKTAAQAAETSARGSQQAAAQSAQEAQASATGAENSALTATQAANTATQQAAGADAAKGAAEAAQAAAAQSAGQAGQAATAAGDHADDAADSATLAQQAAQDISDSVAQITTNKNDISVLKESTNELKTAITDVALPFVITATTSGSKYITTPISVGDTFYIENTGNYNVVIYTRTGSADVETVTSIVRSGENMIFTASQSAEQFRLYFPSESGGQIKIFGGAITDLYDFILKDMDIIAKQKMSVTHNASGGVDYKYNFVQGKEYVIINNGTGSQHFNAYLKTGGQNVQTIAMDIKPSQIVYFTASQNADYLRIYYSISQGGSASIFTGNVMELVQDAISKIPDIQQPYPLDFNFDVTKVPEQEDAAEPTNDIDEIYDLYDALVSAYPNYVTKVDCSEADSILEITRPSYLTDIPIYLYKFSPKVVRSTNTIKRRMKIMILTGVHSDEKFNIFNVARLMNMICTNWATDENACILRSLVDFYIIPLVNPWGYANAGTSYYGRVNGNGVNLNRNCGTDNWVSGEAGSNYGGASPNSEYETKIWQYYAEQLKPDVFIDQHTPMMNEYGEMGICACNSDDIGVVNVANVLSRTISNNMIKEDNNFPQSLDTMVFDSEKLFYTGDCVQYANENLGIRWAFLFEMAEQNKWLNGVLTTTAQTTQTSGTLIKEQMQNIYLGWMMLLSAAAKQISTAQ